MRPVDTIDLASEVLPRRMLRVAVTCLLLWILATGSTAPITWYVTAKADALQQDLLAPMLKSITHLQTPAPTTTETP